jgi:multidrug efflux pump subunit AcrB
MLRLRNILARFQRGFERIFERVRGGYQDLLGAPGCDAADLCADLSPGCLCAFLLVPFLGQNFFPSTDNGSFILHVRAPSGTRIEETARLCDLVEQGIRKNVPANEIDNILDNIGLPYSTLNLQHATSESGARAMPTSWSR